MGISAQRIPTAKANPTLTALKVSPRPSAGHRIVIAAATGAVIVEAAADAGADAADAMAAVIAGAAAAVVAIATKSGYKKQVPILVGNIRVSVPDVCRCGRFFALQRCGAVSKSLLPAQMLLGNKASIPGTGCELPLIISFESFELSCIMVCISKSQREETWSS